MLSRKLSGSLIAHDEIHDIHLQAGGSGLVIICMHDNQIKFICESILGSRVPLKSPWVCCAVLIQPGQWFPVLIPLQIFPVAYPIFCWILMPNFLIISRSYRSIGGLIQSLEGVNLQVVDFWWLLQRMAYIFIYVFGATPPHPSGAGTTTGWFRCSNQYRWGPVSVIWDNLVSGTCFWIFFWTQQSPANCVAWNPAHNQEVWFWLLLLHACSKTDPFSSPFFQETSLILWGKVLGRVAEWQFSTSGLLAALVGSDWAHLWCQTC